MSIPRSSCGFHADAEGSSNRHFTSLDSKSPSCNLQAHAAPPISALFRTIRSVPAPVPHDFSYLSILMTTGAMVFGMLPIALGLGAGGLYVDG